MHCDGVETLKEWVSILVFTYSQAKGTVYAMHNEIVVEADKQNKKH